MRDYLLEKSGYACHAVASIAGSLKHLASGGPSPAGPRARLEVAATCAVKLYSAVAGLKPRPEWPVLLVSEGLPGWKKLEALMVPAGDAPFHSEEQLLPLAARALSSLLDLNEALSKDELLDAAYGAPRSSMIHALNGLTKILASICASEWSTEWPELLQREGRGALDRVLGEIQATADRAILEREDFASLAEEVWLAEQDPDRSPVKLADQERARRRSLTEETRLAGDLWIPDRYKDLTLEAVLDRDVPEHAVCLDYARAPEGRTLVLHGRLISGLYDVQWAIGRYWFVERLGVVGAVQWHDLVADNLMAQDRSLWELPHLLIVDLRPVHLTDSSLAHPGFADQLLRHRLAQNLPTVVSVEGYDLAKLGLPDETLASLTKAPRVGLPPLEDRRRPWM